MSVFYFMSSFGYGEPLKKILSCEAGYSAYEYEYTYHLDVLISCSGLWRSGALCPGRKDLGGH